jgi:DNA-binding transcriptional ArsR family regulator
MAPPLGSKQVKLNAVMFAMLLEELMDGPATAQTIADYTGMAPLTVNKTFRALYRRGVVHIAGWEKDLAGRMTVRVFGLGRGRDAKKPIKKRSELNRKYRLKRSMQPLTNFGAAA